MITYLRYIENDGCLLAVSSSAVNLRRRLPIRVQKIKGHRCGKFTVVCRHHGSPGKILMAFAVHLDALHLHWSFYRLDILHVVDFLK